MSVFVARENNRLSKKFEGVASDNEAPSDSENEELATEIHLEETKAEIDDDLSDDWSRHEYEVLVAQLKGTLPKKDLRKWKTSLEAVDWSSIKVGKRPTEEVERVAKEVIGKVRRFRVLSEMLEEVPDVVSKKLCATRPKPPLTAYSLFVKEKLPQLREEHKDLKVQQIFKLIPEQYKALSAKKRRRYESDAAKKKEEYHVQLAKFYEEHPDLSPKKGYKPKKEPLKTPFHLFYQERREISSNISFQQARKEWEELPVKDKVVFIQRSFEVQGNTDLKLVNKKEMEWLGQSLGKPEFCGRNSYEYYRRKMKAHSGKEHEAKIREGYKNLTEQEQEALKEEYQVARAKFVNQYREYIKKLPKEKQQAEIDFLLTISEKKTAAAKKVKSEKANAAMDEDHYLDSPEEPPAAESTTIKKKVPAKMSTKVAAIKKEHKSDNSDADSVDHAPPSTKKPTRTATAPSTPVASVASPSKRKQTLSVTKTEPHPSASSSDEDEEEVRSPAKRPAASPVKNGKKRTSSEDQSPAVATKKTKVKKEPEQQATKSTPKEPEKPPRDPEEFYRQRIYKGKVGKHKESYANLSSAKKREIVEQLKAAQKQYIVDFELFLKSLPKEEIRKYIQQRAKEQQKVEKTEDSDDDDDDEDDEEDGSSSGDEDDDE